MKRPRIDRLPPGRQLYDPINGLRVGGFAGALLGAVFLAFLGPIGVIFVVGGAVIGGTIGYFRERRRIRPPN